MKNNLLKNKAQINFCNVNLLKFPKRKNKNKENKSPSFFTNSNISNEKETKTETTILDEKEKLIQKLNVRINELENRIKNLESIIANNKINNKNYESINNMSKLITEPSSVKKKRVYSQNQSPIRANNKVSKNKSNDDKKIFKNSYDLIQNLKLLTRNTKGRNLSLSKMIKRTNSIENLIHNYTYKTKNKPVSSMGRNHKSNNYISNYLSNNLSLNNSSNLLNQNDLIPKAPKKLIQNSTNQFKNIKKDLNNIKNRTKNLLEKFSGKQFK